jgi:hypothetical protein
MERLLDNKYESCLVFTKDGNVQYKFHKPRVPQKYIIALRIAKVNGTDMPMSLA